MKINKKVKKNIFIFSVLIIFGIMSFFIKPSGSIIITVSAVLKKYIRYHVLLFSPGLYAGEKNQALKEEKGEKYGFVGFTAIYSENTEEKNMTSKLFGSVVDIMSVMYNGDALLLFISVDKNKLYDGLSLEEKEYWENRTREWGYFNGQLYRVDFFDEEGSLLVTVNPEREGRFRLFIDKIMKLKIEPFKDTGKALKKEKVHSVELFIKEDQIQNTNDRIVKETDNWVNNNELRKNYTDLSDHDKFQQ